ncbi:hypothetical protein CSUB01_11600 [Colletotrichum sublineola]|uniref:Uncharacterized protein n=1 Tax=Colletotrichum sublineola TaxID=1173701 RepID=A0A066XV45_COLSU|nr:hypothetical protein CSUB01_11600 [Colletotrichum sublineola]
MPGNDGKANPSNREEVNKPGGNDRDSPTTCDATKHGASASGTEHANAFDNTVEPTSEPGWRQSRPPTTDETTTQEKYVCTNNRESIPLPRQVYQGENSDPELRSTLAGQMRDPRDWFPSAGAKSLRSALPDDTASSSHQTGTEIRGSQRLRHAGIPVEGDDAEIISPLDLGHGPEAGGSNPELHEKGPQPGKQDASSPGSTAIVLGEENKGLTKVSDLISHAVPGPGFDANPRPLPPIPQTSGAVIPEPQSDIAAARRGTRASPELSMGSVDNDATTVADNRNLLPSLMPRRSATPLSAPFPSNMREMDRHGGHESSRWNIPVVQSEEGASASMLGADVPAPLRIPGLGRVAKETQGTKGRKGIPSENPYPSQDEVQPTITIHTPIPTRPVQINVWESPPYAPEPLASNPTYPTTPPPRQKSQASSQETATPTQGRFRAYELEPPRHGRGFNHRLAPAPDPGTSARTHLFVPPQVLSSTEHARIVAAYNAAFDATSDATKTLLSKRHRYPGYTRDDAALLRKLEFEAVTGEGMDDDAYYALFDLETANDGMISALLEWMQGRTWIKVPFVNRIIHQVCRLMFTSAQEEARLRLRSQRDCDLFRYEFDAADENMAMERMQNSWQRIDSAIKAQHLFAKAHWTGFRTPDDVERNCEIDAARWTPLFRRFTTLMALRKDVEDTIRGRRGENLKEDLSELDQIYRELGNIDKETSDYMFTRNEKTKDQGLFHSDDQRVLNFARFLEEEVSTEEGVRQSMTTKFLKTAGRRMQSRGWHASMMYQDVKDLPKPSIPVSFSSQVFNSEMMGSAPQDPMPLPLDSPQEGGPGDIGPASSQPFYRSPTNSAAGPSSPSQVPAYPPADPYPTQAAQPAAALPPNFTNPWQEVHLKRPWGSCNRCRMLEQDIETKQKQNEECHRKDGLRLKRLKSLERTVKAMGDQDMKAAFKHIDGYQGMFRAELREALQFVLSMLTMEGQRAHDQLKILEGSLLLWQTDESMEKVMTELKPMAHSFKRLGKTVCDAVSQITSQIEKVDSKEDVRLKLLDENDRQRRSLESMKKGMEYLKMHATEAAETFQHRLQEENELLEKRIQQCESQLKDLKNEHEERETDAPQTADGNTQYLKDELERKEAELSDLEAQKKALEEQLVKTREKVEAVGKAEDEKDKRVKMLTEHVKDLEAKLQAKTEATKWFWGPRQHTGGPNFENQHDDRVSQLRSELTKELGKTELKPYQNFNSERRTLLPSLAQSVLFPRKTLAAKQAPDEDSNVFWRLGAFSRRRGEVVAALERGDLEEAFERLESLQAWNADMGPWKTEAQDAEVLRSINFLRSYANLEIGKTEGFGAASSNKLAVARDIFKQTTSSDDTDAQRSWDSLKKYLGYQLSDGEKPMCECEYKPRICAKHKKCGGARYYNFMEEDEDGDAQQADIELTQEASSSLQQHALTF